MLISVVFISKLDYLSTSNLLEKISISNNNYDILNPNFVMNNQKEQINITAKEGDFINADEILLKKNVVFESDNFTILSNQVLFNKTNQTATSNQQSTFFSDKTEIQSEGFEILDDGEKIIFEGKTTLTLKND